MDNLSKPVKILLAVFTVWPIVYMILFMLSFMFMGFMMPMMGAVGHAGNSHVSDTVMPVGFMLFFAVHMLTILGSMVLIAFYIVHLFKTERVPKDQKALWAVLLFLGWWMAGSVYWYMYIWREPKPAQENAS